MTIPPRFPLLALACLAATAFAAETPAQPWPLWDGHESIEHYAKRADLPPTKALDLGNGMGHREWPHQILRHRRPSRSSNSSAASGPHDPDA